MWSMVSGYKLKFKKLEDYPLLLLLLILILFSLLAVRKFLSISRIGTRICKYGTSFVNCLISNWPQRFCVINVIFDKRTLQWLKFPYHLLFICSPQLAHCQNISSNTFQGWSLLFGYDQSATLNLVRTANCVGAYIYVCPLVCSVVSSRITTGAGVGEFSWYDVMLGLSLVS